MSRKPSESEEPPLENPKRGLNARTTGAKLEYDVMAELYLEAMDRLELMEYFALKMLEISSKRGRKMEP